MDLALLFTAYKWQLMGYYYTSLKSTAALTSLERSMCLLEGFLIGDNLRVHRRFGCNLGASLGEYILLSGGHLMGVWLSAKAIHTSILPCDPQMLLPCLLNFASWLIPCKGMSSCKQRKI